MLASKRLQKDIEIINKNISDNSICVKLINDNLKEWEVVILGPSGTPYVDGLFKLTITFSDKYPFEPPSILFNTPIIHPNISIDGKLCISILGDKWHASITACRVITEIRELMISPNLNDPLVLDVANMYLTDYDKFISIAKKYTNKYASECQRKNELL